MMSWTGKKMQLEEKIKASQDYVNSQEMVHRDAMEKSLKFKSAENMRTSIMAADMARKNIKKEHEKINRLQMELVAHVGKKPRKGE